MRTDPPSPTHRRRPRKPAGWAAALLLLAGAPAGEASAGAGPPDPTGAPDPSGGAAPEDRRNWFLRGIDFTHKVLSQGVEYSARGMDSFFATEEAMTETTASFVKVTAGPRWIEGNGVELVEDLRARLDLPGTQDRLKLFVGRDPVAEDEAEAGDPDDTQLDEAQRDGFGLGLEGQLRPIRIGRAEWRLLPAAGVKIREPPDPFLRFRAIRRADYGRWKSRWSNTAVQFARRGFVARTQANWDRPLTRRLVFRSSSRLEWTAEEDLFEPRQRLTLFHRVTPDNRLAYQAAVRGDNEPEWQVQDYYLQIRYRNRFYRKWLFFEVRPRLTWPREEDFGPRWSVLLRFEALFGHYAIPEEQRTSGREARPRAAVAGSRIPDGLGEARRTGPGTGHSPAPSAGPFRAR